MAQSPAEDPAIEQALTSSPIPAARPGGIFAAFDILQMPLYRLIWGGTVLYFLSYFIANTAQGVVAYDLAGSNEAVGLVQFGQGVSMVLLNPFSGALVDRFSKRNMMLMVQVIICVTLFAVTALLFFDSISILFLSIAAFVIGAMFSFNGPTRTALLSELMPADKLGKAMALIQVGNNFPRVAGPSIAGVLLAWALLGATGTYFVAAAIMIVVAVTVWRLPPTPALHQAGDDSRIMDEVKDGIRYVFKTPRVLHTVTSFHLMAMFGFNYFVLMPGYVDETLGVGKAGLGLLLGIGAAGGLIASIVVAGLTDGRRVHSLITGSCVILGIGLVGLGVAPSYTAACAGIILCGAGSSGFQTLSNVMAARYSSAQFIGRSISIMFIAWGLNSLAALPIGMVADVVGQRSVFVGMGIVVFGFTLLLAFWLRLIASREVASLQGTSP